MKYLFMLALIVSTSIACYAKVTPPQAVLSAFAQKFPKATKVTWWKESKTEFEAEFTENGVKHSANFSETGKWLETETAVDFNSFPEKVKAIFNAQHKGAKIHETAKIEKADGTVIYEIEIKEGIKTIDCLYHADGSKAK